MAFLTALLLLVFGACFAVGIVLHLGWLAGLSMVVVPVAVVVGIYRGAAGGSSRRELAH